MGNKKRRKKKISSLKLRELKKKNCSSIPRYKGVFTKKYTGEQHSEAPESTSGDRTRELDTASISLDPVDLPNELFSIMEKNTDDSQDERNRKRKIHQSLPYCFNTADDVNKKREERLQKSRDRSKRSREKKRNEAAALAIGGLTDAEKEKREERLRYDREKSKRYREKKRNEVAAHSSSDFSRDSSGSKIKKDRQKQNSKRYRDKLRNYLNQTKILVAKVYHYFEQEYDELKTIYGDLDLTPLSKFCQRTALATGVSEAKVLEILKDEEGRNADKRQEPPVKRRRARKRSRQPEISGEEDSSKDNADDSGQSSSVNESQMVVVKEEPTEYYNEEPEILIFATVKDEPCDIEVKKEQAPTYPFSLNVKTEPLSDVVDESSLFGDTEIKSKIEIHEEGFS